MLGTIITEWDDGKGLCHQFLLDDDVMMKFAGKCAQIAHDVGFEVKNQQPYLASDGEQFY